MARIKNALFFPSKAKEYAEKGFVFFMNLQYKNGKETLWAKHFYA